MITVFIDDISSISESVFSFKLKNEVIKKYPFQWKQKQEKNYSSSYHFDREDLIRISEHFPSVHEYQGIGGISKTEYIDKMKWAFYDILKEEKLVKLLSMLYGITIVDVEIRWDPDKQPNFKI